ncbi:MAG: hypothetical protein HQL08_07250 [Nitrospirae bacterium]|nr:hypothetical protein [Nitrospirota bacterium]
MKCNKSLEPAQQATADRIIEYGLDKGYSFAEIEIAIKAAWIESNLGKYLGPPHPTPDNPHPTASGLFGYTDPNWHDYHPNGGEKNDFDNQIAAFYDDMVRSEARYGNLTNDYKDNVGIEQYIYIKHHDGSSYADLLNAPGLKKWDDHNNLDCTITPADDSSANDGVRLAGNASDNDLLPTSAEAADFATKAGNGVDRQEARQEAADISAASETPQDDLTPNSATDPDEQNPADTSSMDDNGPALDVPDDQADDVDAAPPDEDGEPAFDATDDPANDIYDD